MDTTPARRIKSPHEIPIYWEFCREGVVGFSPAGYSDKNLRVYPRLRWHCHFLLFDELPIPVIETYVMNTKLQNQPNDPGDDLNMQAAKPLNPAITNARFLANLEPEALSQILAAAEHRIVLSKELIIRAGEKAERLFLVVRGNARYYRLTKTGDEILLQWLTPSYVFGLGTLLKDPPGYLGNAQALSDCELLIWTHNVLRDLAARHPQISENALAIVLQYLRNYSNRHLNLSSRTAGQRLAEALLNMAQQAGQVHSKGIEVQTTNEQLSSFADVSPFTASRLLNVWERKGTVSKRRGKVLIHAPEDLVVD